MKRIVCQLFVALGFVLLVASCQKAPFLTLNSPRSYTFTGDGGTQSITFACNRDWNVSYSEPWLQVSPSSGSASDGEVTVKITCAANTTYDPRSAAVTIKVEELSEAVSISQDGELGLFVSPKSFDLTYAEQTIEVEVQKNVQYSISIDEAGKNWITHIGTKGLSSEKASFKVAGNETCDNRVGKITFKQQNGDLSQTVQIKQAGQIAVTAVILDKTNLRLEEGKTETIVSTVQPDDATDKTVTWSSSDSAVATVDETGKVTAVKIGNATITAKAGSKTETCKVVVIAPIPEGAVDLGLSVYWAKCNLGATAPEEYGDYYAWGEVETKEEYNWTTYKWYSSGSFTKYYSSEYGVVDNKVVLEMEDDVAYVKLGGKWRMPTSAEVDELVSIHNDYIHYHKEWTTINGHKGWLVTYLVNNNSIFLPFGGCMSLIGLVDDGESGRYWSSSLYTDSPNKAWYLHLSNGNVKRFPSERNAGFSIRPVYEWQ